MSFEILKPFGPAIYKATLEDNVILFFKDVAKETKTAHYSVGQSLAGNIKNQFAIAMNEEKTLFFNKEIKKHVHKALEEFDRKYDENSKIDLDKLKFNFGSGPWINFQRAGEFNPIHTHTGELSAIIYIDIPECIAIENNKTLSNAPCAGAVSWIFGSGMLATEFHYTHQPKTGELFLFPSGLQHMVYPFKSDVERVSLSFNVYNIMF